MARPAAAPHGPNHCGDLPRSPYSNTPPTPSAPAEKATARQDQARKSCADDGGGDCQEYPPRCGHDLSGEQNSYSTVIEGRGAQEMVALVLRPKPEESV